MSLTVSYVLLQVLLFATLAAILLQNSSVDLEDYSGRSTGDSL